MIHLIVSLKGRTVGRFDVEGARVRIGRHPENEVQIDNMSVSRFHCLLELGPSGWEVEDQGSHNGTLLNRAKTNGRAPLTDGDTIGVGQFQVGVRTDDVRPAEPMIAVRSGTAPLQRERLSLEKGFLLRENRPGPPLPLVLDLFQFGALGGCDVAIPGPRKRALIVRGHGGFQLVNVGEPVEVAVNGEAIADTARLTDGDRIRIADLEFVFHFGLPPDDSDQSTMEINLKDLPPGFLL